MTDAMNRRPKGPPDDEEILQVQEIARLEREKHDRKRRRWRNILLALLAWMIFSIVLQKMVGDTPRVLSHCDQLLQQSHSFYDDETHDRNLGDTVQADHDHGLAVATFAQWEDANCATEGDKPGYVPGYGNVNTP